VVLSAPGRVELLTPDFVVLGMPSEDEYRPTLEDGNDARDKALPQVIVTWAVGDCGTIATSC